MSKKLENIGVVKRVEMTCGGGMGGAHWFLYGIFDNEPEIGKLVRFTNEINGEVITINPKYIVTICEKRIVRVVSQYMESGKNIKQTRYYWLDVRDDVATRFNKDMDFVDEKGEYYSTYAERHTIEDKKVWLR